MYSCFDRSNDENIRLQAFTDGRNGQPAAMFEKRFKCTFTWKIQHFTQNIAQSNLKSPIFTFEKSGLSRWRLQLFPDGIDESCYFCLSVYLTNVSKIERRSCTDYSISLVDIYDERRFTFEQKQIMFSNYRLFGVENFVSKSRLFADRNLFLPNNTLTIICEINHNVCEQITVPLNIRSFERPTDFNSALQDSIFRLSIEKETSNCIPQSYQIGLPQINVLPDTTGEEYYFQDTSDETIGLSVDLMSLFKEGKLSDVTLRVDKKEIKAHKVILSARSGVFSSMFEHKMKENLNNCVDIHDMTFETLEQFISYIYSGRIGELNVESAMDLFSASDKYAVSELNIICLRFLQENLTVDNCLEILVLADLHSKDYLKESTIDFISVHFEEVSANPDWKNKLKERQHLAFELLMAMSAKSKRSTANMK